MSDETNTPEDVSELRKAAAGGAAAKAEAALVRKELAFVKAGINTDTKPAQALIASYDGELTAEAIRSEAKEWSLLDPDPDPATDQQKDPAVEENEAAAQAQVTRETLSAGAAAPNTPPDVGGVDAAFKQFLEDKESGISQVEATNRAYGAVIKAAAQGDKQATFSQQDWEAEAAKYGHGAEYAK